VIVFGDSDIQVEDGVLVLTKSNIDKAIAENGALLVDFCKYISIFGCFYNL